MKKYALFSFVFILSLILLGFNANSVKAANCAPGDLFNTTTGQACGNTATACAPGDLYSSLTGQPCSGINLPSGPQTDNSFDVAQFNNLFKSNFTVGVKSNDVKPLQQFLKDQGYYFGKVDGKYGKITARAVKDFQDDNNITNTTTPIPPVISGGSGGGGGGIVAYPPIPPVQYPINCVSAGQTRSAGNDCCAGLILQPTSYSGTIGTCVAPTFSQAPVISKIYGPLNSSYLYNSEGVIVAGKVASIYGTGLVGNLIVKIADKEVSVTGDSTGMTNADGGRYLELIVPSDLALGSAYVSIKQISSGRMSNLYPVIITKPDTTSNPPVISGVSGPQSLNVNQQGTWTVNASDPSGGNLSYRVDWGELSGSMGASGALPSVQQTATFTHAYVYAGIHTPLFTVTNSNGQTAQTSLSVNVGNVVVPIQTNSSPVINGVPAIPSDIKAGQSISFSWHATDVDNDDLSWSVDWGDGIGSTMTCAVSPKSGTSQGWSHSDSHTWTRAGTYTVKVNVSDCKGGSDSNLFVVNVGNVVTPTQALIITTPSPLPNAKVGQPYSVTLNTSGIDPNNGYNWSVNNGAAAFPVPGLGLDQAYFTKNSFHIIGTPADVYLAGVLQTNPYTFTFNVTVSSGSQTATKQFTLTVDPATTQPVVSPLIITTASPLPNAKVGQYYFVSLNITGGSGNYNWSLDNNAAAFPVNGLGFSQSNTQSPYSGNAFLGTPASNTNGTYTFTVNVASGSQTVSKQFTLTVDPATF